MKILFKWSVLTISIVAIIFFLVVIFSLILYLPGHTYDYDIKSIPLAVGLPVRLEIPKINVKASIEHLGLTPQGAMDTPKGPVDVAWFNLGPRPGDIGSAVIAGHYGTWKNGEGSVFDNLNRLRKGDRLYVKDEKGDIITFVVKESRIYQPDADALSVFNSSDGKSHLNLITCEGVWNSNQKTYSNRLVIFADKE